jgi:ribonuclease VapC
MVVDTSALIAIAWNEPERERFQNGLEREPVRLISAASVVEASIVVMCRAGRSAAAPAIADLNQLIEQLGLEIEPVTPQQMRLAQLAYQTYGKGLHAAGLNFGDCFAYALAKATGRPLLFKGSDFAKTDLLTA